MTRKLSTGALTIFTPRNAKLALLPTRPAWPIHFDGFEEFSFRLYQMDGLWAVGELSTGLPIIYGQKSKQDANDAAIQLLNKHGIAKTRATIAAVRERITDWGIVGIPA
jgi:hypothetical protein